MPRQHPVRHPNRFRTRFATGLVALLALTATAAPTAWADPQPLARAEAAIAANHSPASRYTGPCSEACSGGGYAAASQPSWIPDDSGATLPHDPRPRPLPPSQPQTTSLSEIQQGAKQAGLHPGVFGQSEAASNQATAARVTAPDGGFDWGDAGIGAGGMLVVTLIGAGGLLTVANRRNHRTREEPAS